MSDNSYGVVAGVVQFEPKRERVVNGQTVCDVTIKALNIKDPQSGEQKLVSVTIWPEFANVYTNVKKGDTLIVDGTFNTSMGQDQSGAPRQYINWSPTAISYISAEVRAPRQVVQAPVNAQPAAVSALATATHAVAPITTGSPF